MEITILSIDNADQFFKLPKLFLNSSGNRHYRLKLIIPKFLHDLPRENDFAWKMHPQVIHDIVTSRMFAEPENDA